MAMDQGLASWWRPDGGLDLPNSLSFEAWEELGGVLVRMEKGILWCLGDWLNYGERRFGDRAFQAVVTGYATGTLRAAAWVSHRFPKGERDPEVPWSHYRELAGLPEEAANELLVEVKTEKLSQKELRTRVRASKSRAVLDTEQRRAHATPSAEPGRALVIADPPWDEMTMFDLCRYKVHPATQSVLFLWAPVSRLSDAMATVTAWGYVYRAHLVWTPVRAHSESPWVDTAHDLVLIGARGDLYPRSRPASILDGTTHLPPLGQLLEVVAEMYPDLEPYVAFPAGALVG
jgi:hypothetical protein